MPMSPSPSTWSQLDPSTLRGYALYRAKGALMLAGLEVYTPEGDTGGVDLLVHAPTGRYHPVRVTSARRGERWAFIRNTPFEPAADLLFALVVFEDGAEPDVYLMPSEVLQRPAGTFASRFYDGIDSPPEWTVDVTESGLEALRQFHLDEIAARLRGNG